MGVAQEHFTNKHLLFILILMENRNGSWQKGKDTSLLSILKYTETSKSCYKVLSSVDLSLNYDLIPINK